MRFELVAASDVDALWNEFLDLGDYSCVVEQVYGSPRVEVKQQIDVAVRALGPARGRAEEREVFDPELPKARRGHAKNVDDHWKFAGKFAAKCSRAGVGGRRACVAEDGSASNQTDAGRFKSRSDGGKAGPNRFPRGALKVNDGEPRDAGLPGQLSLSDAEERAASPAHFGG